MDYFLNLVDVEQCSDNLLRLINVFRLFKCLAHERLGTKLTSKNHKQLKGENTDCSFWEKPQLYLVLRNTIAETKQNTK